MKKTNVGFIGFGEVASILSKPIRENGADVKAYDIVFNSEKGREYLQSKVKTDGIQFASLVDVVTDADYVLSTVTTQAAKIVAEQCSRYLKPGQVYIDLNSTEPSIKKEINSIVRLSSGADFIEGAILGAIGATGVNTRILIAGEKGKETAEILKSLGLDTSFYSLDIGKASMFKMLRSIFSKGLEALLIEFLIAGKRAGIGDDLWKDISELMTNNPFEQIASNWVQSHTIAYERRYHEMVQVVNTMKEIGIEPLMTSATETFFKRSLSVGFREKFPQKPDSMEKVIEFMERL